MATGHRADEHGGVGSKDWPKFLQFAEQSGMATLHGGVIPQVLREDPLWALAEEQEAGRQVVRDCLPPAETVAEDLAFTDKVASSLSTERMRPRVWLTVVGPITGQGSCSLVYTPRPPHWRLNQGLAS